jgi:hypothetical protein
VTDLGIEDRLSRLGESREDVVVQAHVNTSL